MSINSEPRLAQEDFRIIGRLRFLGKDNLALKYEKNPKSRPDIKKLFYRHAPFVYTLTPYGMSVSIAYIAEKARTGSIPEMCTRDEGITTILLTFQRLGRGGTMADIWNELYGLEYDELQARMYPLRYMRGFRSRKHGRLITLSDLQSIFLYSSSQPQWYKQAPIYLFSFEKAGLRDWWLRNREAGEIARTLKMQLADLRYIGGDVEVTLPDVDNPLNGNQINYEQGRKLILIGNDDYRLLGDGTSKKLEGIDVVRLSYENREDYLAEVYPKLNPQLAKIRKKRVFDSYTERFFMHLLEDAKKKYRRFRFHR